jgi:hypothetical protein
MIWREFRNLGLALVLAALLVSAGCLGTLSDSSGGETCSTGGGGSVNATGDRVVVCAAIIDHDTDWSIARGCTWTIRYQVANTGDIPARNVRVNIALVTAGKDVVRDARTIYVGALMPGESRVVAADLDGECLEDYTSRAVVTTGE